MEPKNPILVTALNIPFPIAALFSGSGGNTSSQGSLGLGAGRGVTEKILRGRALRDREGKRLQGKP